MKSSRLAGLGGMAGLLLLAVSLSGCSTIKGWFSSKTVKEPAKLTEIRETARFETLWRFGVGDTRDNVLQPAVTQDAVYAANNDGRLYRIDRASGREVWRADTKMNIAGGVGAGDGLVVVGSDHGEVAAFGEDGKPLWSVKATSEVLSAPQIFNGVVVVRTGDGRIAGLKAADGSRQWYIDRATPALIVRSRAGVLIEGGTVYAGFAGGKLAAIRLNDGVVIWESAVSQPRGSTELERISDITSEPVVGDGIACAVAFQGKLACFDLVQGNLMWSREISSDRGLTQSGRYLYLADVESTVFGLDKTTGGSLWKNEGLSMRRATMPATIGDFAVVGDFQGYLHALSKDDGGFAARTRLDSAVAAAPVSVDDTLYVQTTNGSVYALALRR